MLDIDENLQQTEPDSKKGLGNIDFILRRPKQSDIAVLVDMANNPTLAKNLCSTWLPTNACKAQLWLENANTAAKPCSYPFVITDMKGNHIGAACLMMQAERTEAEVSVVIARSHWQQGFATRSLQALADFAFSNPNKNEPVLQSIFAQCRVSCGSSRRVVEKCGFQYCGTGMASSQHYRGMIPIDRYRFDRGIWTALRHWAGTRLNDHTPPEPANFDVKGAA